MTTTGSPRRAWTAAVLAIAAAVASLVGVAPAADAAPVVHNGLIAFNRLNTVTTMRPDGSDVRPVATHLSVEPAWLADGSELSFIDTPNPAAPGQNLVAVAPDGSGGRAVVEGFDGYDIAWSPDGTQFAYTDSEAGLRKHTITLRNADGTNVRQPFAGDASTESHPSWFPSGDRLVMVRDGNIVAADADGTGITTLVDDATFALASPNVSRDGSRIVFTRLHTSSTNNIFVANADGTNVTQVGSTTLGTDPAFSPDATQVVFVGDRDTGIWTVNIDGTELQQRTTSYADRNPVWQYRATPLPDAPPSDAPYNGKVSFLRGGKIFTANPDGTGITDLQRSAAPMLSWTRDGSTLGASIGGTYTLMQPDGSAAIGYYGTSAVPPFAVLSPDGAQLAFSRSTDAGDDTFISDRDLGNEVQLALPGAQLFPAWSADGAKIAFQANTGSGMHVWVMDSDGSDAHQVPNQPAGNSGLPRFSPDGTRIVFANDPTGDDAVTRLYVIRVDGSGLTAIGPTNRYVSAPSFSPDGEWILFSSHAPGYAVDARTGLYVMKPDGTNLHQITLGNDDWPSWQPLVRAPTNLAPRALGGAVNSKPLALLANAGSSWDFDGTITRYEWRWGDNTAMTPYKYAWHKYAQPGTYLVRLTVRDNAGAVATKKAWITVN